MARKSMMIAILAATALSFSLSSCADGEGVSVPPIEITPGPSPSPTQVDPSGELVSMKTMGGECAEGACPEGFTTVSNDGSWTVSSGDEERQGKMSSDQLAEMMELIPRVEDSVEKKSSESCESWVDGRDTELFYVDEDGDGKAFTSCKYEMNDVELLPFIEEVTSK